VVRRIFAGQDSSSERTIRRHPKSVMGAGRQMLAKGPSIWSNGTGKRRDSLSSAYLNETRRSSQFCFHWTNEGATGNEPSGWRLALRDKVRWLPSARFQEWQRDPRSITPNCLKLWNFYGLWKTKESVGCQQLAATKAISAASKKGSQSSQTRPPRSKSRYRRSTWHWHSRHSPGVFLVKGLTAKLMPIFVTVL